MRVAWVHLTQVGMWGNNKFVIPQLSGTNVGIMDVNQAQQNMIKLPIGTSAYLAMHTPAYWYFGDGSVGETMGGGYGITTMNLDGSVIPPPYPGSSIAAISAFTLDKKTDDGKNRYGRVRGAQDCVAANGIDWDISNPQKLYIYFDYEPEEYKN